MCILRVYHAILIAMFFFIFQVFESKQDCEKMVKNKNIGGRHHRSSTCKTKKADSQIASDKDDTPPHDPADDNIHAAPPELLTTIQGQLGFPDRVYLLASVIFQNNHLEKPVSQRLVNYGKDRGLPLPVLKDEMQRASYELAFNTLKCKSVSDR